MQTLNQKVFKFIVNKIKHQTSVMALFCKLLNIFIIFIFIDVWQGPKYTSKSCVFSQPTITCSKLTIETLEQGVKYVQS